MQTSIQQKFLVAVRQKVPLVIAVLIKPFSHVSLQWIISYCTATSFAVILYSYISYYFKAYIPQ